MAAQTDPFYPVTYDGWQDEVVYFYGRDGRWRFFRLTDFGIGDLPYQEPGAMSIDSLSEDGTRWAAAFGRQLFVLDMQTGKWESFDLPFTAASSGTKWTTDSRAVLVMRSVGSNAGVLVSLRDASVTRVPYDPFTTGYSDENVPVELQCPSADQTCRFIRYDGTTAQEEVQIAAWIAYPRRPYVNGVKVATLRQSPRSSGKAPREPHGVLVANAESGNAEALLALTTDDYAWTLAHGWLESGAIVLSGKDQVYAWDPSGGRNSLQLISHMSPGTRVDVATNWLAR